MNKLTLISRFIFYYFRAKTLYKVHSPFVFDFCEQVLDDDKNFYHYENLEAMRNALYQNNETIQVTDFGAGSHVNNSTERSISSIAKSAVSPANQSRALFRLVNHYRPETMLEFGTSLGLTAAYQALANPNAKFISLEGCPNISIQAKKTHAALGIENIEIKTGEFNTTLDAALKELGKLDYVFFDGNHQKEPTLAYFEKCYEFAYENSIFIFDDIHWSDEMEAAWNIIKEDPRVTVSIDLFFMGVVFFRKEQKQKEDFTLIPGEFKIWQRYI